MVPILNAITITFFFIVGVVGIVVSTLGGLVAVAISFSMHAIDRFFHTDAGRLESTKTDGLMNYD